MEEFPWRRKTYRSVWFTEMISSNQIGIVIVSDGVEEKAYIGTGLGKNQREDEIRIADRGAKFPLSEARRLIN